MIRLIFLSILMFRWYNENLVQLKLSALLFENQTIILYLVCPKKNILLILNWKYNKCKYKQIIIYQNIFFSLGSLSLFPTF